MVAPMKKRGLLEVRSLLGRARRLRALRRITPEDFRYIEERLEQVEERIIRMREHNDKEPF